MNTITIPKKLAEKDDLVIIPRGEYERLFRFWASAEGITNAEKRTIAKGFRDIAEGKFVRSKDLKHELGL